ncbi:MAG: IS3 family transposase, partial [Bacilli bacterium]|nr:IS3 family transposase [Bacilli bacterium]
SSRRYGYRKITRDILARFGDRVNHKKVLRMMNEMGIYAHLSGHDKGYSSYRGKVGKVAPNLLKRDFHAEHSLEKCGTDVTEFKLEWGKVYLSPIIDFYNDEILGYALSLSPNMKMIDDMLKDMYSKHPLTNNMMLHSDQGWQYQMESYQENLRSHGIIQSMSRKGNCLDNSKTENFFSKLKKELFYGHEKEFRNFAEFQKAIDEYIEWYNNERIVERLGGAPVFNRSIAHTSLLCYSSI